MCTCVVAIVVARTRLPLPTCIVEDQQLVAPESTGWHLPGNATHQRGKLRRMRVACLDTDAGATAAILFISAGLVPGVPRKAAPSSRMGGCRCSARLPRRACSPTTCKSAILRSEGPAPYQPRAERSAALGKRRPPILSDESAAQSHGSEWSTRSFRKEASCGLGVKVQRRIICTMDDLCTLTIPKCDIMPRELKTERHPARHF